MKTIDPPVVPGDSDAVLFVITCTNDGPYDWGSDYFESITYTVCCNGSLEIAEQYSQTGEKTTYKQLTDEDFTDISLDMTYAYNKQPWTDKDYSDYIDGYTWGFKYYNAHGKETYIYGGYTDGCGRDSRAGAELERAAGHKPADRPHAAALGTAWGTDAGLI